MEGYNLPDAYRPDKELTDLVNEKINKGKIHVLCEGGKGNIPILSASGKGLAEAWENSLIALWTKGFLLKTDYDSDEKPPSQDCTMHMIVEEPLSEPMIHRAFPGGLEDLEEYRQEVLDGIKDHWIRDPEDPDDERWEYTYHERMFNYKVPGLEKAIDQFETMANNLAKSPITRRAQMISWKVWDDSEISDPACFQSYWGRCRRHNKEDQGSEFSVYREDAGELYLNLNMRFRSRDAYDAAFMNDYAFILLADKLAKRISEIKGEEVKLGRFEDSSDSYHIYGRRFDDFNDRFLSQIFARPFEGEESRTWNSTEEAVQASFDYAKPIIEAKVRQVDERRAEGDK